MDPIAIAKSVALAFISSTLKGTRHGQAIQNLASLNSVEDVLEHADDIGQVLGAVLKRNATIRSRVLPRLKAIAPPTGIIPPTVQP